MKRDEKRPSVSARPMPDRPKNSQNNVRKAPRPDSQRRDQNASKENGILALLKRTSPKIKILAAAALIAVIFIACMAINISIGVREIEILGNELCTREEILGAAEIEEGSGYFSYNTSSAEKRVRERFYCVEQINISRSVFGKVTVKVTETKARWYVESYGEYFALSDDLRSLRARKSVTDL